ncbi:MAG: B12-binding domain-containing radical SAM protein [Candidatus Omnitrophica bacterium]|nr:B12-binding domain-containing radical SAM protein [Candidatus Omnitrophota bacterium]
MNALFVYSTYDVVSFRKPFLVPEEMHLGISYIAAVLKRAGHRVDLAVLSRMLGAGNERILDESVSRNSPAMILFTAVTSEYDLIKRMARYMRGKRNDIYLVIGGPHASLNPEEVIMDGFDAACVGEGEYPVLELAGELEKGKRPSGIRNFYFRDGSGVERNPTRPFLEDIDGLPFPRRDIWEGWIAEREAAYHTVLLARGCPFECTYCSNHALKGLAEGKYVRMRSAGNILTEISGLCERGPGIRNIYLEVETIGVNIAWMLDLCEKLRALNASRANALSFGTNLRVTPVLDTDLLFEAFGKSGFRVVNIGVESGSERVRKNILKRKYSNGDIIRTVKSARKYGIKINFYNLIGVPGETEDDIKKTIALNRECQPDKALTHIFAPYPGTALHRACEEKGILNKARSSGLERTSSTLELDGLSRGKIQKYFTLFDYYVYSGKRPMASIMAIVLVKYIRSKPLLHGLYRRITGLPWIKAVKGRLNGSLTGKTKGVTIEDTSH